MVVLVVVVVEVVGGGELFSDDVGIMVGGGK